MKSVYDYFPEEFKVKYEIREWGHALAILASDFPEQLQDIIDILIKFELRKSSIIASGGGKSKISEYIDGMLAKKGWVEKGFDTAVIIDGVAHKTPTHKVDCVKARVALDIEWNNKTEFYDRDLNNFRILHTLKAISVGIIVTRTTNLQVEVFNNLGEAIQKKYGSSTTYLDKLIPRIEGGGAGGCPLLVVAIKPGAFVDDC
jgi:Restriction endonuclease BglII